MAASAFLSGVSQARASSLPQNVRASVRSLSVSRKPIMPSVPYQMIHFSMGKLMRCSCVMG